MGDGNLDVHQLRSELKEINAARTQVNERLRSFEENSRGRGRMMRGRGSYGGPDRGFRDRFNGPGADHGPPVVRHEFRDADQGAYPPQPPPRRLLSSVIATTTTTGTNESNKRSADGEVLTEQPEVKRRNRRLFGALLTGTLQKFKEEEDKVQGSVVAQRRAEMMQKAEQRKAEESERMRRQQAENAQKWRSEELGKRKELSLQADIKRLEILYAQRLARRETLDKYLQTTTQPALKWKPAKLCRQTKDILKRQKEASKPWREAQLKELAAEKEALIAGKPLGGSGPKEKEEPQKDEAVANEVQVDTDVQMHDKEEGGIAGDSALGGDEPMQPVQEPPAEAKAVPAGGTEEGQKEEEEGNPQEEAAVGNGENKYIEEVVVPPSEETIPDAEKADP